MDVVRARDTLMRLRGEGPLSFGDGPARKGSPEVFLLEKTYLPCDFFWPCLRLLFGRVCTGISRIFRSWRGGEGGGGVKFRIDGSGVHYRNGGLSVGGSRAPLMTSRARLRAWNESSCISGKGLGSCLPPPSPPLPPSPALPTSSRPTPKAYIPTLALKLPDSDHLPWLPP